jgi:predicted RNase H-like HicB family nuclease
MERIVLCECALAWEAGGGGGSGVPRAVKVADGSTGTRPFAPMPFRAFDARLSKRSRDIARRFQSDRQIGLRGKSVVRGECVPRRPDALSNDAASARIAPRVVTCFVPAGVGATLAPMTFIVELEREQDGRWLAEVPALSGVMCYGQDRDEAVAKVQALAARDAERLEHREAPAEFLNVTFKAA